MSAKRAKEYLNRYHKARRAIALLERSIEEQAIKAQGVMAIRYDKDRVQTSPLNKLEADAVRLMELREQYADMLRYYQETELRIIQQVEDMPNPTHSKVLHMLYLETDRSGNRISLTRISNKLHISYDRICHIHGDALQEFDRRYLGG